YLGQIRADAWMYALVEAIGTLAIAVVIWYAAGYRGASEAALIPTLWAFIEYINKFFVPVRDLSQKYAVMQGAMAACERIFQLLDTKELDGGGPEAAGKQPAKAEPRTGAGDPAITLEGVHFSYGAEPVLR